MTDNEIVALYFDRNENAINETQIKYGSFLSGISGNILSDLEDVKECVGDTYFAAWRSIPPNRPEKLSAYLARIVRQLSIDRFRRLNSKKRYRSEYAMSLSEMEEIIPGGAETESEYDAKALDECINSFLRSRTEEERSIFAGRYFFNDSINKVASYYGYSEGKVKSMLFRMRSDLKAKLIGEGFISE